MFFKDPEILFYFFKARNNKKQNGDFRRIKSVHCFFLKSDAIYSHHERNIV